MKAMIRLLPILLALPLLAGCTGQKFYSLKPAGDDVRWHNGHAMVRVAEGDLEATVAYVGSDRGRILFNVIVENRGDTDVLVAPERFYYDVVTVAKSAGSTSRTAGFPDRQPGRVMAVDPEIQLGRISLRDTSNRSPSFLDALMSLSELLPEDEPETEAEIAKANREEMKELRRQMERRERSNRFQRDRTFWSNRALRKTTLDPGETVAGLVAFSSRPHASLLQLALPVGEVTIKFEFEPSRH